VRSFHSFSAHADAAGLLAWLGAVKGVAHVFLVHGEEEQCLTLADLIRRRLGLKVEVPRRGERYELSPKRRSAVLVSGDSAAEVSETSGSRAVPRVEPSPEED